MRHYCVELECNGRRAVVYWSGTSLRELKRICCDEFGEDIPFHSRYVRSEAPAFMLLDVHHGVYYENFSDADVEDGCHILVLPQCFKSDLLTPTQSMPGYLPRFSGALDAASQQAPAGGMGQVLARIRTMATARAMSLASVARSNAAHSAPATRARRRSVTGSGRWVPDSLLSAKSGAERLRGFLDMIPPSMRWRAGSTAAVHPEKSSKPDATWDDVGSSAEGSSLTVQAARGPTSAEAEAAAEMLSASPTAPHAHEPLLGARCVQLDDAGSTASSEARRKQPGEGAAGQHELYELPVDALQSVEVTAVPSSRSGGSPAARTARTLEPAIESTSDSGLLLQRASSSLSTRGSPENREPYRLADFAPARAVAAVQAVQEASQTRRQCRAQSGQGESGGTFAASRGSSITSDTSGSLASVWAQDRESVRFSVSGSVFHIGAAASSSGSDEVTSPDGATPSRGAAHASASSSGRARSAWQRLLPPLRNLRAKRCSGGAEGTSAKRGSRSSPGSRIRFSDADSGPQGVASLGGGQPHDRLTSASAGSAAGGQGAAAPPPETMAARAAAWDIISGSSSGAAAVAWSSFIACTIALAVLVFIIDSHPTFYTPAGAQPHTYAFVVDILTTVIFTIEIALRMWACPRWRALLNVPFAIDVIVVLPAYVELATGGSNGGPQLSVLRVFRLLRVLRLFRVSRSSTTLLLAATARSLRVLLMLVLLLSILMTVIASLMHVLERGAWDAERREWHRELGWDCAYAATRAGDGAFDTPAGHHVAGVPPMCRLVGEGPGAGDVTFRCNVSLETGRDCHPSEWDRSPFGSIPASLWWVMVTMFTIGYGDATPVTVSGRMIAAVVMVVGILMIALPITVIGYNFSHVYKAAHAPGRSISIVQRRQSSDQHVAV